MRAGASTEETRAHLQERLAVLAKVLCLGLGATLLFSGELIYELYPPMRPHLASYIFAGGAAGIAILALAWRVLARATLTLRQLETLDLALASGAGIGLACSAYFAPELRAAAYTALVLSLFVMILRAIIVPSTPTRAAVAAAMTSLPLVTAAIGLVLASDEDVPGPVFVIGAIVITGVATALVATGSGVIHGLRRQADAAVQLGHYTLDKRLAQGGMGVVYRAHHVLLRRPTAVKVIAAEHAGADTLARFEREVQYTSQLTHPNTVAVFDYGPCNDGAFYYAMELLDGIDLEQLVRRHGPQPPGRVVHLLVQVCGALQEAHDRGIIHRDIKPANIIACRRGAVPDVAKVVDFGLVREIARDAGATQAILGTPAYLAPEAITSPELLGPPADLYALGAVGYFLLTGRPVFTGANPLAICLQHVTAEPAPLDAPPAVAAAIVRCLAKAPGERFASARDLELALRAADPGGWDDDRALAWWAQHDTGGDPGPTAEATQTITVRLEGRP